MGLRQNRHSPKELFSMLALGSGLHPKQNREKCSLGTVEESEGFIDQVLQSTP